MQLSVDWKKPIVLKRGHGSNVTYTLDLQRVGQSPGVYIFARKWGRAFEALYVGKSQDLRSRINGHLNNLKLMNHIENAKNGKLVVIVGNPQTLPGQQMAKVIKTLERSLIRHFLSKGHALVNKQGTRIKRHEIESRGGIPKAFVPSSMYLEKNRGE